MLRGKYKLLMIPLLEVTTVYVFPPFSLRCIWIYMYVYVLIT